MDRVKAADDSRLRILTEVSQQIISILDINELLERVVRLIQQAFGYYHVGIGLVEGDDVVYRVGAGELWDDPNFQFKPQRLKLGMEGLTGWVASTGEAALVPDVTRDSRYIWMQGSLTRSELTVPITVKGRTIGVLDAQSQALDDFDQTDLELLQVLANQTGIAIENARLFAVTERRAEQFRVLMKVSRQITSILDINELLKQLVQLIQRTFNYYHIEIGLIEGDEVVFNVGAGKLWDEPGFQAVPSRLNVRGKGITSKVAALGKPFIVPEVKREPDYVQVVGSRAQSELAVPIMVKGRVIGVLDVESDRLNDFDETDLEVITSLANQAGIAIENARLFAETQRHLKDTEKRAYRLTLINSLQQGLASKLDVQSIYELVGEKFRDIFGAQVVMVSSYDSKTGTVEHNYCIERGQRVHAVGARPPGGFRAEVIRTREPLLVNANVAEEATRRGQPTLPGTDTPKSWLGAPMMVGDQVTGIISVQNLDEEYAFNESDIRFLQMFTASISIALENARLYEQAQRLAALEERQRLARELHDSVTQSLYGINLYAEAALGQWNAGQGEQLRQSLADIQATAQESLADMRRMIYELRPPILEREGLAAAIQNRLFSVESRAGLKSSFSSNLETRLPISVEEGLYGIVREALNNTLKHACAHNVTVTIMQDDECIRLEISDDGVGFDPDEACREGCLGIASMQERAREQGWRFKVQSEAGAGTRVRVEVKR